jgi:hypothetical protein
VLEGVLLDAVPDLLGHDPGLPLGESRKDGLVLVAAEAGGPAASFSVQLPDNASDRADDELAQEVTVFVVDLFEVVYIRHKDAQGFARSGCSLQLVFELLVEAFLGKQPREVVAVDQVVQGLVKPSLYRIIL